MLDQRPSADARDKLVCALAHLRHRYGASQISLDCLLQHAEVAIFLEQRRLSPADLLALLNQLQCIGRICDHATHQSRELSAPERHHVDRSLDSIFSTLIPHHEV